MSLREQSQLASVLIALLFVISAAGYGIARGLTNDSNAAYEYCVREYEEELPVIMKFQRLPPASSSEFCQAHLLD